MTVSDITIEKLADYLRLTEVSGAESSLLTTLLAVAKSYICGYTGLSFDQLDEHSDLVIVVYILVQDMFDNRMLYVNSDELNSTVRTILGLYRVNLL